MKRNSTKTIVQLVFSIVATMLLQMTNAQVVYTDVNPDITTSVTYNLDLNNDGTIDFVIQHTSSTVIGKGSCKGQTGTNHYIKITPLNTNQVLDIGSNPKMLLTNDVIKATPQSSWSNQANQLMIGKEMKCTYACFFGQCGYMFLASASGEWLTPVEDGYLGLRINSGGHSYFGWARLGISHISFGAENFTIKDYAINTFADQPIYSGQTTAEFLGVLPFPNGNSYFCTGNSIMVSYFMTGQFPASNIVTVQLSDAVGSFANPTTIGSAISNVSGTINAFIPGPTPTGGGYRIRVTSSNPMRISYPVVFPFQVNGPPVPSISSEGGSNICGSGSINLVSDYDYNAPWTEACLSYQWRLNGNDIPGANASSYLATAAGSYTCVKSNGAVSVTSNVIQLLADPFPPFIQLRPGSVVCGEPAYLNVSGMAGTCQWKLNENPIPGATGYTYTATVSGSYTCLVTNTCGSLTSNNINVSIGPAMPNATITATGPTIICGGQVTLNANTGPGLSYQWYDVGLPYSTDNPKLILGATSSSYPASVTGVYIVKETNSAGCTRESNYIVVLVGNPEPFIYPSSDAACQVSPFNVNLHAEPSQYISPANAYSYQWINDGANISNATAQDYAAKKLGNYSVRVTLNSGGCSGTSAGVQIISCSNSRSANGNSFQKDIPSLPEDLQSLSVAPNPVSGEAKISFILQKPGKVSLTVYDMAGRLIKTLTDKKYNEGVHQISLDTKELNAEIYLLRLQSSESVETKKIVVLK